MQLFTLILIFRTSKSEDQLMLMENLQNSPDVDDCSGSVHTLLLESAVTPIADQPTEYATNPAATFSSSTPSKRSPPRRQYSSESNESSPEKVSHKQRSSAYPHPYHHPQLNTTYTISPDISTSSLISASEHYNGGSLLIDNICSPQTSNSSPDTPEWSLIDSFHKPGKNGDKLQNVNDSPSKRPLLANQEKDEDEDDYDEPYNDLKEVDSEDSINNRGNKIIITIGNKSGSPIASDSTLDNNDTYLDLKMKNLHNQNEFQRQPSWTPLPSSAEGLIVTNRDTSPKKQSPISATSPFQQNGLHDEEEDLNYAYATPYSPNQEPKSGRNHPYVPPPIFASSVHANSSTDSGAHLNRQGGIEGSPSSISSSEESESDLESIHSYHPPAKVIDIPSAKRLATRLFQLDGFKKTDVSRHLSRNNEYNQGEYHANQCCN